VDRKTGLSEGGWLRKLFDIAVGTEESSFNGVVLGLDIGLLEGSMYISLGVKLLDALGAEEGLEDGIKLGYVLGKAEDTNVGFFRGNLL